MADALKGVLKECRITTLRCHLCGDPISLGETFLHTWTLGAVHEDYEECRRKIKEKDNDEQG